MYKIQRNDMVKVASGKDRGKKGKVTQVLPEAGMVVIDGVNKVYRHIKPQRRGESGQRIEVFGPIHMANVQLICPNCSKPSRVGFMMQGTGKTAKKVRVCRKCKKPITAATKVQKKA